MTGTFSTIGLEDVISRAKIQLRLGNTTEYDDFFSICSYEALDSLNALSQLIKKQCPLTFEGSTAELPKDFVRYLALKLEIADSDTNDPINNQLLNGCQMFLYADTNFLNNCGCDTNNALDWNRGGFQINDGYIHLNSSSEVTEATLAYLGVNVDKDGKTKIYERYERGIAAYICYKFTLAWSENYNQYVINEYKQEWMAQRSKLIGQDVAQSFQNDKREIQNIWGSMLVSKAVNYNI